jgi:hypothetical protein
MSASLLFINIPETAKMDCGVSNRTSYDMSKAFDTVSKNIQKIAWSRMGVPADVVDWLVDMDTDGVTVVISGTYTTTEVSSQHNSRTLPHQYIRLQ